MTPSDDAVLALLNEGLSRAQIAARLGVTRNVICGKVHRMKQKGLVPETEPAEQAEAPEPCTVDEPQQLAAEPMPEPEPEPPPVAEPAPARKPWKWEVGIATKWDVVEVSLERNEVNPVGTFGVRRDAQAAANEVFDGSHKGCVRFILGESERGAVAWKEITDAEWDRAQRVLIDVLGIDAPFRFGPSPYPAPSQIIAQVRRRPGAA